MRNIRLTAMDLYVIPPTQSDVAYYNHEVINGVQINTISDLDKEQIEHVIRTILAEKNLGMIEDFNNKVLIEGINMECSDPLFTVNSHQFIANYIYDEEDEIYKRNVPSIAISSAYEKEEEEAVTADEEEEVVPL